MRTRRGRILAALATTLVVACCGGADRPRATSATVEDPAASSTSAPDVTVAGRVAVVLHPRLFSIDDDRGGQILVVIDEGSPPVEAGQHVRASGQVLTLDPRQFAARFGLDVPAERIAGFVGVPCLVASTVAEDEPGPGTSVAARSTQLSIR